MGRYLAMAALLTVLATCSRSERWNVVLVTFDTTRADHLGCYGFSGIETPTVDGLAADGVLFEQCFTPVPITCPSHSSILTGKVPFVHGVRDNGLFVLGDSQISLAEILHDAGYKTGAAVGSFPLLARFGLNQGFDFYDDKLTIEFEDIYGNRILPKSRMFFDERRAGLVNEAALPWLEANHKQPFFLWVHYFDPHHPHEPPPPFGHIYADDLYSGEIAYADHSLGALIANLKRLGVYDNTLIVFTADHGEGNNEHNESTHSFLLYNATLHVPLIIKVPGGAKGVRVADRVATIDIMPTILDWLGLTTPAGIQGRSLKPTLLPGDLHQAPGEVPFYAETLSPRLTQNWGELRGFFDGPFKYINGPRCELFDLEKDPRELHNLLDERAELTRQMRQKLTDYLDAHATEEASAAIEMDPETYERLLALGYVHASGGEFGPIEERLREDGIPPQDRIEDVSAFSLAKSFLSQQHYIEAREILESLVDGNPENPYYLDMLSQAEYHLGRYDACAAILEKLLELGLNTPPRDNVLLQLGHLLYSRGDFQQAVEKLDLSQQVKESAGGRYLLAKVYETNEMPALELQNLQRALELDETFVPARIDLAIRYANAGEIDSARANFHRALRDHPYFARTFYNYGAFLMQEGQPDQALTYLNRAIELQPNYPLAHYALIALFTESRDEDGARRALQSLEKLVPGEDLAVQGRQLLEAVWPSGS